MKVGDLIKHKNVDTTGIILSIFMSTHHLEYRTEEYVKVIFSGDLGTSTAPLKLLKENWEVISEI
tara:strand:+ start:245 stop:439 length:195 start_codon:yes stop_codon:yes gene_type:complete